MRRDAGAAVVQHVLLDIAAQYDPVCVGVDVAHVPVLVAEHCRVHLLRACRVIVLAFRA
jgi:hypothetical protein